MAIKLQLHIRILAAAAEEHLLISLSGNAIHLNRELLRQNKKGGVPGHGQEGLEPDSGFLPGQSPGLQPALAQRNQTRPSPGPRRCVAMSGT